MREKEINKKQEIRNKTVRLRKFVVYAVILLTTNIFSQDTNSFFIEGNKLYQQEKYNEAISKYLQIEEQEEQSAAVYYNLGNAYYRTNKIAASIYYYEKALQLAPNDKDIKVNLAFANRMTLDNIEALPSNFLTKISKKTIEKLPVDSWAYIAVSLSFIFALLFLLYHFSNNTAKKRLYFITGTMSFISMLICVFFAYKTDKISSSKQEAIVFAQQTTIKVAPVLSSETVFKLHEGTKVSVLETMDNWKKIKIADGQTGWIIGVELKEL